MRKYTFFNEDKSHKKEQSPMKKYSSLIKSLFSDPLYHIKLEYQSRKKMDLTKALQIKNHKIYNNYGFSYRSVDDKADKKRAANIEPNIVRNNNSQTRSQTSKPKFCSYKKMKKNYNKYFSFNPSLVDLHKKEEIKRMKCDGTTMNAGFHRGAKIIKQNEDASRETPYISKVATRNQSPFKKKMQLERYLKSKSSKNNED